MSSFQDISNQIKQRKPRPVYFLHGEENYFIDKLCDLFTHQLLDESQKAFDQTILYGRDSDARLVLDYATRFPVIGPYQMVMVKEAQDMKTLENLEPYLAKPFASTILVLVYRHKKLDGRTTLAKTINKSAEVFEAKKIYEKDLPEWLLHEIRSHHLTIKDDALHLLIDHIGADLEKLAAELEKIYLNIPAGGVIDNQLIADQVGINREYNMFELQRALAERDRGRIMKIFKFFSDNPKDNHILKVISILFGFYTKLLIYVENRQLPESALLPLLGMRNAFMLKDYQTAARRYQLQEIQNALHNLKVYDLKTKGLGSLHVDDEDLIMEMAWLLTEGKTLPVA